MATHDVKADPMAGRIARWTDIQRNGVPVMFIDSVLPGHYRMNYSVIGDTASENPDFEPAISAPHKFQIGMFEAPPGNGPGWHTHTYVELFMPLTGTWRFIYGDEPDDAGGQRHRGRCSSRGTSSRSRPGCAAASRTPRRRTRSASPCSTRTRLPREGPDLAGVDGRAGRRARGLAADAIGPHGQAGQLRGDRGRGPAAITAAAS